ncbi:MAG: cation:proton antiporter [Alphaproteobacteria bacterium]|nr:cation:proton antiporter [Alphaproteobacteria bacterium]MBO7536877.1 cation:proton antiporter [Alphaproteobacteria bacterium]MBO7641939.1 cation:proton antiporter [Alphaproteobacteria bacterium]
MAVMSWTITRIASVVLCAMGAGFVFSCFGYTPVLGYIIAGLLLGPSVLAIISDIEAISVCSEMGIIFLLFVIGQGLSFEKVKNIWRTSVSFTVASTVGTYLVLLIVGWIFGMSHELIVLSAFCITLSSTAVTVKSLDSLKDKEKSVEENTFGILVAQDIVALAMVLIVNLMASGGDASASSGYSELIALALFSAGLFLYFTRYHQHVHKFTNFVKRHEDMLSITIFGICLGSAVFAEVGGFSAPFGAFIAGLILGNSDLKNEVKNVSEPIEELFLMTFFLSVGLMVDLNFIWDHFGVIMLALFYITVGKTALNIALLKLFKFSSPDSFVISVLLGHVGEFSFMLAFAASKIGLIEVTELKFLVSLTALSLFLSPFWLIFAERCRRLTVSALESSALNLFLMVVAKEKRKLSAASDFVVKVCKISYDFVSEQIKSIRKTQNKE